MATAGEIVNWKLVDAATMMEPHLRVASFLGAILVIFFLVVKLYSTVPIRLIPPPVVVKEDPLFRWWTREWQSLTYQVRAILDGDVFDNLADEEPVRLF